MVSRYGLRDEQWKKIKEFLPGPGASVGVTAKNNRLFVDAVLYRYRAGIPWRDLPRRFGDFRVIHARHTRLSRSGVWERVFKQLAQDADNEYAMIDATIVRVHQQHATINEPPCSLEPPASLLPSNESLLQRKVRMVSRHGLRDEQWKKIKDILPGREGSVGLTAKNNRLFVDAVLYRYRAGIPWRDLPRRFGDFCIIHARHIRWGRSGVWKRVFRQLAQDADNEYAMIGVTIVRAHQQHATINEPPCSLEPFTSLLPSNGSMDDTL